jgi:Zn-finger nucleic acid-binding protein
MEAGTLHCQSCGASVGENDLRCPYCNSQLATLACPKCLGTVSVNASHCPRCGAEIRRHEDAASDLACPGCKAKLFHTSVGEAHLDQCHACGGVWVAQTEFEKMAADREERGEVLGTLPGDGPRQEIKLEEVHYRPCPACAKLMNRTNYGHTSGVVLDLCKEHGLWFDRDKLRKVLQFIEGGGLEKNRAREVQELEEQRHQAAVNVPQQSWSLDAPVQVPHGAGLLGVVLKGLFGL